MEDLEPFYPDRMAGRILGMGDVLSFVEKAQEVVSVNIKMMDLNKSVTLNLIMGVDETRRC